MNHNTINPRPNPWRWPRRASCGLLCLTIFLNGVAPAHGPAGHEEKEHAHAGAREEHHDEVTLSPEAIARYGIETAPAGRQVLTPSFSAPARIGFNLERVAHVGVLLHGRVVELNARKGEVVKRGDALFTIESTELGEAQSDYLQKKSAAQVAAPAVELAQSAYERAEALYRESGGISLTELQKRQSEYQASRGALRSAESGMKAAENKLRLMGMKQSEIDALAASEELAPRHTATAPISGRVTEREITLGELVGPQQEALMVLAETRTLWVIADVPEARLDELRIGARARITVAAAGKDPIEAKVTFIDPVLDPNTRSAHVRIEIRNDQEAIRPGMFARAEIFASSQDGGQEAVVAIASEAVQSIEGRTAVFVPVAGEKNTFAVRRVVTGQAVSGMTPIMSGLSEGERVMVRGSFILKAELGKSEAGHEH